LKHNYGQHHPKQMKNDREYQKIEMLLRVGLLNNLNLIYPDFLKVFLQE
jgi:hypothetical protein